MIIEHVHLTVKSGLSADFELAFEQAKQIIAPMQGLKAVQLIKSIEHENAYILLIFCDRLEDHQQGFRQSAAYQSWKKLLHPFYDRMPTVEYYQPCMLLKLPATSD